MPDIEHLQRLLNDRLDKKQAKGRASVPFPIIIDADLAVDLSKARAELMGAQAALDEAAAEAKNDTRQGGPRKPDAKLKAAVDEAQTRVDDLEKDADDAKVILVFVALPAEENDELMKQHPPREGNKGDEEYGYNTLTFPVARMYACAAKVVGLNDEPLDLDPKELVQGMSTGERDLAVQVVNGVNQQLASVPFFDANSQSRRRSGGKSRRR